MSTSSSSSLSRSTSSTSTSSTSKQIDGWGDFCFSPWWYCDTTDIPGRIEMINSSKTSFLSLPGEVRNKIYQEIIAPFRHPKTGRIRVQVDKLHCHSSLHPIMRAYVMTIPNRHDHCGLPTIKSHHYESLRSLANTNHQIRTELGSLFWKKVALELDDDKDTVINFLEDRPLVCHGIQKISMGWTCQQFFDNLDSSCILGVLKCMTENLVLDEFEFVFYSTSDIIRKLLSFPEKELPRWVKDFRMLRIEKKLHVTLELRRRFWDSEQDEDFDFERKLEALLRPSQIYLEDAPSFNDQKDVLFKLISGELVELL